MDLSINDLIERIKSIQPLKNLESIGFSQNTINNWKYRNTFPKSDDLYKISQFLNVSMEYLLTGEDKENNLTPDETELLRNYRLLTDDMKAMLSIQVSALATTK